MLGDAGTTLRTELTEAGSEDEFWNRVRQSGAPRVAELDDGRVRTTFLFRQRSEVDPFRVYVDAGSLTDHHASDLTTMTRLNDTGIWFWETETTRGWRGSYRFMPVAEDIVDALDPPGIADTIDGIRSRFLGLLDHAVADEYNPRQFGSASLAEMPDAPVQRWWNDARPPVPGPRRIRWDSSILGNSRNVWIHETPGSSNEEDRPLIVVLDGQHWIDDHPLAPVVDRAARAGALPPAVFVFVDSLDHEVRGRELPCNREFWAAVVDELIPRAAKEATFTADPRRTVASGQSYGGLASLYAGLEFPERFGLVSSQSGSFWWPVMSHDGNRGPDGGHIADLVAQRHTPPSIAVDMTVGIHEGDMVPHNRHIRNVLRETDISVTYGEFDGGHEWLCWRGELVESLIRLLEKSEDSADQSARDDDDHDRYQHEKQNR